MSYILEEVPKCSFFTFSQANSGHTDAFQYGLVQSQIRNFLCFALQSFFSKINHLVWFEIDFMRQNIEMVSESSLEMPISQSKTLWTSSLNMSPKMERTTSGLGVPLLTELCSYMAPIIPSVRTASSANFSWMSSIARRSCS